MSGFESVSGYVIVNIGKVGGRGLPLLHWAADPIDLRLADKLHVEVDYLSRGAAAVRLSRVYHSNASVNAARVTVPMGAGWHMFYDRSLQVLSSTQVRLHRANGRTLDFTFNGTSWVSSMPGGVLATISGGWTYVNHRDVIETYDANGRLVGLGEAGLATSLQYDANGRLTDVTNPFGRHLGLAYDSAGRVTTVTLPDGHTLGYGYDANNNLASIRFADGAVRQYVYENSSFLHALTGVIDESGRRRLTWGYDSQGRPNQSYYGNGTGRVNVVYNGSQVTTTDARGTQRTRNFATVAGRQVLASLQTAATADSAATGWSFAYDANGNPLSITTRSGEVQQVTTDSRGRETVLTRAAGTAQALGTQTTWHPTFEKPTQAVSAGVTDNYTIDTAGRVTQIKSTAGGTTTTQFSAVYNAQNLLQSVTDARGTTLSYTYDGAGNIASVTNTALNQTTYYQNYDAHGQPARIQRPDGTVVTRTFDTRGRMATRTDPSGTTQYAYDGAGRVTSITAPDGSWKSFAYDTAGLLSSISNNRGETTTITRDASGTETQRAIYSSASALSGVATRQIDAVGRVASIVDSRNYKTQFRYAGDGRPSGVTDPLNLTKSLQLDTLNRSTAVTQPNTTAMIQAGAPATATSTHQYDTLNNHRSTTDTAGVSTSYAYDSFNRRSGEVGADPGSISLQRNAAGDVTSYTDALGVTYNATRDAVGRITSIRCQQQPDSQLHLRRRPQRRVAGQHVGSQRQHRLELRQRRPAAVEAADAEHRRQDADHRTRRARPPHAHHLPKRAEAGHRLQRRLRRLVDLERQHAAEQHHLPPLQPDRHELALGQWQ
jgi:YD repeat-containing protein